VSIVGGIRDRLLKDSFFAIIQNALDALGWRDTGRYHRPVTLIPKPQHWGDPITPNTVAVDFAGSQVEEYEVGSRLTRDTHIGYAEVFAQDDSLGTHLANDLRDWLRGRLQPAPVGVTFPIYDYRQGSTPPIIGYMDITGVTAVRNSPLTDSAWLRHWFSVQCEINDAYLSAVAPAVPSYAVYPAFHLLPGG
jgi:hypothetical protein